MKNFVSTRGKARGTDLCNAILKGAAPDGGLYVPDFELPQLDLEKLISLDYATLAAEILSHFASEVDRSLIAQACSKAYSTFPPEVVPVRKAGECYIAELFHGRTAAFKDLALSLLPHLMTLSQRKTGESRKAVVLVATSGDTGKAALEGFKDVEGTSIIVFYPTDGVSPIQKLQMTSQEGSNVTVIGIDGNFDDAQRAVKASFEDAEVLKACSEAGVILSSANSINIARLLPQCVYYIWSYLQLVRGGELRLGDKVNFCVPSGNFGNALAGWMASGMGLPVGRFLIASNPNHILTDFFTTGSYDTSRPFLKTMAPAMDILISSNVERLLWYLFGSQRVSALMNKLKEDGSYSLSAEELKVIQTRFSASYLTEDEILTTIHSFFKDNAYLLDTHTACAVGYLDKYRKETEDKTPTVVMATASPYKFPESVLLALTGKKVDPSRAAEELCALTGVPIPSALSEIDKRKVLHHRTIDRLGIVPEISKIIRHESKN